MNKMKSTNYFKLGLKAAESGCRIQEVVKNYAVSFCTI